MKLRAMMMAAVMAAAGLASTRVAYAQDHLVANVPFAFAVGSSNLPAGEYTLRVAGNSRMLLLINRTDPNVSVIVPANSAQTVDIQAESKLVFHRYGDRYFLAQVWQAGSAYGKQLPRSNREKEMQLTARVEERDQVIVALNR